MKIQSETNGKQTIFLSMVYITLFLASMTVGYKIVAFGHELYCASILIFPLLFPFSDALTELYGAKIAKNIIWYTLICEIIFVSLTNAAIKLPSPSNWHHQEEYNFLAGSFIHILLANATALLVSFYLNVILLNKWRILLKGKRYYLRSLGATAVGEITYTFITNTIAYFGVLHWNEIVNIIVSDYVFKFIYSAIIAYPAALFVTHIKISINKNNEKQEYNPFNYQTIQKVIDLKKYAKNKLTT
jgi:uncharacterized integral membrane protein (TIGR00697 family)